MKRHLNTRLPVLPKGWLGLIWRLKIVVPFVKWPDCPRSEDEDNHVASRCYEVSDLEKDPAPTTSLIAVPCNMQPTNQSTYQPTDNEQCREQTVSFREWRIIDPRVVARSTRLSPWLPSPPSPMFCHGNASDVFAKVEKEIGKSRLKINFIRKVQILRALFWKKKKNIFFIILKNIFSFIFRCNFLLIRITCNWRLKNICSLQNVKWNF